MENQSNPEQQKQPKPLFDDCSNCEQRYQITADNSAAYEYHKQPECNFLFCICPNCNGQTKIFIGQNGNTLDLAKANGLSILEGDYADDNIYGEWCELKGITPVQTYELTPRHEELLGRFATVLATCPDDLLYDAITTPQPPTLPERWV